MSELPLTPLPPNISTAPGVVVLGRFQPLHLGHISLIEAAEEWRLENCPNSPLVLCIGSSNRPESMENPWNYREREAMMNIWLKNQEGFDNVEIVSIPDIENPPKWVAHAEKYHGKNGFFFTSDNSSAELYSEAGWNVIRHTFEKRNQFEGWRVRATALMLSTISDEDAIRTILSISMPESIINYLIEIDGLRRLAFLVEGGEPVG
ncbi:MAG: adenylyltransferase/cytidyltransferase family protein [Candidatus Thalassarchaeaceae archaeon]